jgi:gamma-glutamyltranspeptidase/glutathione hydrolase
MVAASHWLAAQTGMGILERGGNAFDAAVAAGFVLEVVEPHQNGPGGEAPMIVYSAADDAVYVVDGQGPAPHAATPRRFRELGLDLVPGTGLLAACVPAALGSWLLVLERFGTMSLRDVLSPAIGYASEGFPALASLSGVLRALEPKIRETWPTSEELWLHSGVPARGCRVTNRPLAATFQRILEEAESAGADRAEQIEQARRAVYEGFVADSIDSFVKTPLPDDDGVHAGLISGGDLASWRASLEAPVSVGYRDLEVFKTGPWGQGPVFLQQLALLSGYDIAELGEGSAELVHVVTECSKLAFADREAFYGDPRFVEVPLAELLSEAYNDLRRLEVGPEASTELRPGRPGGREPVLPARLEASATDGDPRPRDLEGRVVPLPARPDPTDHDTCHLDVADRFGNLVSATPSGGWLQSSPAVPGLGFCLGTRAQMFWLEEGLPASLAAGKRPRTTLSPSLAFRDGSPYLAFGTPGGDQQDQWTVLFLIYHADLGLGLQASIDAATWHTTHAPSSFYPRDAHLGELIVEESLGTGVIDELRARGHAVVESAPWTLGRVTAVARGADGLLRAGADPRAGQAYAVGR